MAFILCVANQKGGSGKTTTAMNLAAGLTLAKYPVLVVDADPQASATIWSLADGQNSLPYDVITARQVRGKFEDLARGSEHEIVIVDCPPGVVDSQDVAGRTARDAIRTSDAVLVPLRPTRLDFSSTSSFVRFLASERQVGQRVLILLNGVQPTLLGRAAPGQAMAHFGGIPGATMLATSIGLRTSIAEVCGSGRTIFDYAPGSDAVREYTALTKEVIQCLAATAPTSPLPPSRVPLTSLQPASL
jgi:chromosome partitioning protein